MPYKFNPITSKLDLVNATTAPVTPGGSDTQLQYNNAGAFGGITGATSNGTAVTYASGALIGTDFKAAGAAGIAINNSAGTQVALFGAGPSTGISLHGTTNIGSVSADYIQIAGGTGSTTFTATGSSSNINIDLFPKGTGVFSINSVETGATGAIFDFYHNSSSPAANDEIGILNYYGKDSGGNKTKYADITGIIISPTNGAESGAVIHYAALAGARTEVMRWGNLDSNFKGLNIGSVSPIDPSGANVTRFQAYNSALNSCVASIGGGEGSGNTFVIFSAGTTARQFRMGYISGYGLLDFVNMPTSGALVRSSNSSITYQCGTSHYMIWGAFGGAEFMRISAASGDMGVGTGATISARVHAIKTTEQLRIGYSTTQYFNATVGSAGTTTFNAVGTTPSWAWNVAGTQAMIIDNNRDVAIGVATADARLHAVSTTEQLRLGYDASNYASFTVDAGGDLTISALDNTIYLTGPAINSMMFDFSTNCLMQSNSNMILDTDGNDFIVNTTGATFNTGQITLFDSVNTLTITPAAIGTDVASFSINAIGNDFYINSTTAQVNSNYLAVYDGVNTATLAGSSLTFTDVSTLQTYGNLTIDTDGNDITINGTSLVNNATLLQKAQQVWYDGVTEIGRFDISGFGIGTSSPSAWVHIEKTTEQLRVGYNSSNYFSTTVGSTGSTTFNLVGTSPEFIFSDPVNIQSSLQCDSIVNDTGLAHGTYTPTGTGVTNITTITPTQCQYMRVGNTVTVSGQVDITPTINNARTTFALSLPIASNFGNSYEAGGSGYTMVNTGAGHGIAVYADATNNRLEFDYFETHGATDTFTFTCTYLVI